MAALLSSCYHVSSSSSSSSTSYHSIPLKTLPSSHLFLGFPEERTSFREGFKCRVLDVRARGNRECLEEENNNAASHSSWLLHPNDSQFMAASQPDGRTLRLGERRCEEQQAVFEEIEKGSKVETGEGPMNDENDPHISRIPVEKQRYIPVSKSALVNRLSALFSNEKAASDFLSVCSCLDAILHAEHKPLLEELRLDYRLIHASDEDINENGLFINETVGSIPDADIQHSNSRTPASGHNGAASPVFFSNSKVKENAHKEDNHHIPHPKNRFSLNDNKVKQSNTATKKNSVAAAARFQRNFLQLLKNAQFQGLSARDLQLTSALNSDYLLTLPIEVDWKRASSASAIIFRRGYAAERQEGFLFGEKLDYMQSLLLRKCFSLLSKPLLQAGVWINQRWKQSTENVKPKTWTEGIKEWLKEPLKPDIEDDLSSSAEGEDLVAGDSLFEGKVTDLPIYIAAQQAVPRYETFLSSAGSRGMLLKKILIWMHVLPPKLSNHRDSFESGSVSEPDLRRNYLTRISMRDIWLPASNARCGSNLWHKLQAVFSVFFSWSTLQEPAFKELVLLYSSPKSSNGDAQADGVPKLQLKIYRRIPIPDLKVVFPNKKLSFRILDTVRLDTTTFVGLLAFLVNYRFDNFLSSPSAFLLDIIATFALIVYITRVIFGYKQTWDRYQLLVNKTLYEKTLASGFGAAHFLVDASEQQKFKEAVLAYAILLHAENGQVFTREKVAHECEHFLYSCFKEQIEMPVDDALEILLRLGLVTAATSSSRVTLEAVPCARSYKALKQHWDTLLYSQSIWSTNH